MTSKTFGLEASKLPEALLTVRARQSASPAFPTFISISFLPFYPAALWNSSAVLLSVLVLLLLLLPRQGLLSPPLL